jgi:hypothetical protein
MEFLSVREFSAYPRKTRETLKRSGKIVLTNNGKPSMLVFDITERDFETLIDTLNRAEAMRLLEEIQMQAVRGGLNSMTMDEINAEVTAARRKRKGK